MAAELVPLNNKIHQKLRVKPSRVFSHAKHHHMAQVSAIEFGNAATEYPIAFVKDSESGKFRAVVVLGLNTGQNLYYSENKWNAFYVPNSIKRHPFGLAGIEKDSADLSLCLDMESELVSEDEGIALFDSDHSESEYLIGIKQEMTKMVEQERITDIFINKLVELELLVPYTLTLQFSGEGKKQEITGLYSIDEKVMKKLDKEKVYEFHQRGYLAAIQAHLISLGQFNRLLSYITN